MQFHIYCFCSSFNVCIQKRQNIKSLYKRTAHCEHNDVIKWKHFRVTGPLCGNSPVTGFDVFFDLCLNNQDGGDLRRHRVHHDVTVMKASLQPFKWRSRGHQDDLSYQYGDSFHYDVTTWMHFFASVALCEGNLAAIGGFPSQRISNSGALKFVFYDERPNERLNEQTSWTCFETPWSSRDIIVM